jgi:hypothetical protein
MVEGLYYAKLALAEQRSKRPSSWVRKRTTRLARAFSRRHERDTSKDSFERIPGLDIILPLVEIDDGLTSERPIYKEPFPPFISLSSSSLHQYPLHHSLSFKLHLLYLSSCSPKQLSPRFLALPSSQAQPLSSSASMDLTPVELHLPMIRVQSLAATWLIFAISPMKTAKMLRPRQLIASMVPRESTTSAIVMLNLLLAHMHALVDHFRRKDHTTLWWAMELTPTLRWVDINPSFFCSGRLCLHAEQNSQAKL